LGSVFERGASISVTAGSSVITLLSMATTPADFSGTHFTLIRASERAVAFLVAFGPTGSSMARSERKALVAVMEMKKTSRTRRTSHIGAI
jgi:hypothetical protein